MRQGGLPKKQILPDNENMSAQKSLHAIEDAIRASRGREGVKQLQRTLKAVELDSGTDEMPQ